MKKPRQIFCAKRFALLIAFLLPSNSVLAVVSEAPKTEIFSAAYLVQVAGSLLLVFGCLFGLVFVMKKLNGVPVGDRKSLRIVSSVKVGNREKIMLLDTGEGQVLVGVAAGSVRTLYVYSGTETSVGQELPSSSNSTSNAATEPAADFAALMPSARGGNA